MMLEKIKLLLGLTDSSKDELLTLLLDNSVDEAIEYTHNTDISNYVSAIEKMVVYNYNRLGDEGLDAKSYSGINQTYSSDYPENIMRILRSNRKIRTI